MTHSQSKAHVLVVEDDPATRSGLETVFRQDGYSVESAEDGCAALAMAAERRPDVVVTDLEMPAMDGFALLGELRARFGDLPVIVVTGMSDGGSPIRAMRAGAADYLVKPIDVDELLLVVERAIEQAQCREQLEAERIWLRTVIDKVPVAIFLHDASQTGRVTANPWVTTLLGSEDVPRSGDRLLGQVRAPDGTALPAGSCPSQRALRGEVITGEEVLLRHADGSDVPVLLSAAQIRDGSGHVLGSVLVADDLRSIKEIERLRQEWTSLVAHDLRQPIQSILLRASLLATRSGANVDVGRSVAHLCASARLLDRMVSDLADVSRVETRHLHLDRQRIELPQFIRAAVERVTADGEQRDIDVRVEGDIPQLNADPERLEQLLGNLLSNAFKYGTPGALVAVAITREDSEVRVSVTNRGQTIDSADLPELFTRFFRTRVAKAGKVKGLGLGLYIAKQLAEAHGGRIWAESESDTTTFTFTLPLYAAASSMAAPSA